jgi:hypothetical protein
MAKLEMTRAGNNTTAQRKGKEATGSGNSGTGGSSVMTAAMAMHAVQDGTRRLGEVGRKGF